MYLFNGVLEPDLCMYLLLRVQGIKRINPNWVSPEKTTRQSVRHKTGPHPSERSRIKDSDSAAVDRFEIIRVNKPHMSVYAHTL